MAAPAVSNLNDVIASLTAANQPNLNNLNEQDQNITTQGNSGVAGINAAKDTAFNDITANAGNRGALFSGFSPDAQAKYTASTYLPALAKLQEAITNSRTALAGQKASLLTGINNQANAQVQGEKTALQQWQDQQDKLAAEQGFTTSERQATEAFTANQNDLNRAAAAANSAAGRAQDTPTQPQYLSQIFNSTDSNGVPLWKSEGATENIVIPQVAQNFGLSIPEAKNIVYAYRQQYYYPDTIGKLPPPIMQDTALPNNFNGKVPLYGNGTISGR